MTFTLHDLTDFLRRKGTAQRINIIDHSCFHNHWPASKMKLHENLFESKGAPWCFGGPTQLAYYAYREDRLCISFSISYFVFRRNLNPSETTSG